MLKNIIILPDGTELSSGVVGKDAVMLVTLTEAVNNGEELTIGSTCASLLEATVWNPGGRLALQADEEITLYTEEDDGTRTKVGIFIVEKPTRVGENTIRVTGYDRIVKLDKDLSEWIISLQKESNTLYRVYDLVNMIEEKCGVNFIYANGTENNFFTKVDILELPIDGVTGRMLVQWIGEFLGAYCHANSEGSLEFNWYYDSDITLEPKGPNYYYNNGLQYEDYEVSEIDAVQLRIADKENGYLWPVKDAKNPYLITGNPLINDLAETDRMQYGSTLLPIIPEWDTAKYPYASISISGDLYYLNVVDRECYVEGPNQFGGYGLFNKNTDGELEILYFCSYVVAKTAAAAEKYKSLYPGLSTSSWTQFENDTYGLGVALGDGAIWTNTNLYFESGTLYLAASEPKTPEVSKVLTKILEDIESRIKGITYTPCSITVPAEIFRNFADYSVAVLPEIPKRNTEKYPYAHIEKMIITGELYVVFTDRPVKCEKVISGDYSFDSCFIDVNAGEYVTYLQTGLRNGDWEALEEYVIDNTLGTEIKVTGFPGVKWSNHDIIRDNGSVYLIGTNPEVFSKRVPRAIKAGQMFRVVDRNGVEFKTLCMKRVQKGQRVTLSCTGGPLRSNTTTANNTKVSIPQKTLTQTEIFSILTNGGEIEGLYMKDGQLYVNASYLLGGNLDISGVTFGGLSLSWHELEDGTKVLAGK